MGFKPGLEQFFVGGWVIPDGDRHDCAEARGVIDERVAWLAERGLPLPG